MKKLIASSGYCFHSKFKDLSSWEITQTGDFEFINKLLKNNNFNRIFIDKIMITSINNNINFLGNYGAKEK